MEALESCILTLALVAIQKLVCSCQTVLHKALALLLCERRIHVKT